MELPNLGDHCALTSCSRLDFLPVKCGGCRKVFCGSHYPYSEHSCPSPSLGDARVPVCPLCDRPIPVRRKGDPPDLLVSQHIDTDCQSDPAKENRNKVFDQRCTFRKCKKKEMIRIVCDDCKSNFCLQHRHPKDHKCEGAAAAVRQRARDAAALRQKQGTVQDQIKSDEAMAKALQSQFQQSIQRPAALSQEEMDRMLALSLSQQDQQVSATSSGSAGGGQDGKNCVVS